MIWFFRRSFFVALVAAAFAGCSSAPEKIVPKGNVSVAVDPAKKSTAATAPLHHAVAITLPPAVEGHVWQLSFHDTRYLQQTTDLAATADRTWSVSFLTLMPGRTRLRFMLVPAAGGRAVAPADSQELLLSIQ